jgi:ribosome biogenesis SPOUT family RNA methylase Rps3
VPLDQIPFDDHPTITFNKHEAIEMPFRYVKDENGQPILPPGMREHLHADLNRTIDEF